MTHTDITISILRRVALHQKLLTAISRNINGFMSFTNFDNFALMLVFDLASALNVDIASNYTETKRGE